MIAVGVNTLDPLTPISGQHVGLLTIVKIRPEPQIPLFEIHGGTACELLGVTHRCRKFPARSAIEGGIDDIHQRPADGTRHDVGHTRDLHRHLPGVPRKNLVAAHSGKHYRLSGPRLLRDQVRRYRHVDHRCVLMPDELWQQVGQIGREQRLVIVDRQ